MATSRFRRESRTPQNSPMRSATIRAAPLCREIAIHAVPPATVLVNLPSLTFHQRRYRGQEVREVSGQLQSRFLRSRL